MTAGDFLPRCKNTSSSALERTAILPFKIFAFSVRVSAALVIANPLKTDGSDMPHENFNNSNLLFSVQMSFVKGNLNSRVSQRSGIKQTKGSFSFIPKHLSVARKFVLNWSQNTKMSKPVDSPKKLVSLTGLLYSCLHCFLYRNMFFISSKLIVSTGH